LNKTTFLGLKTFTALYLLHNYIFAYILGIVTFCPENTDSLPMIVPLSTMLSTGSGERFSASLFSRFAHPNPDLTVPFWMT